MVNIIIITYNSEKHILDCLYSLKNLSYKNAEIILVDNKSTDDTIKVIENSFNDLVLIKSQKNLGFTGGCNLGLKHSSGEFIALINPDVVVDKEWLSNLLKYAEDKKYNDIGIFASKIIDINKDKLVIDSAGDRFSTLLKGFKRGEGEEFSLYDKSGYIFGACAGAALYRREMVEEVGFLDEDFFLIHEDTDFNLRTQLAGWKVLYVPSAVVYHKVRSSIGQMSETAVYYTLRNSEFVKIKNVPLGVFLKCLPEFIFGTILEFIYFVIKHKQFRIYFKAKTDVVRMLPMMLKKRAVIMKNRKVSNEYIMSLMTSVWQSNFLKSKIKKFINA